MTAPPLGPVCNLPCRRGRVQTGPTSRLLTASTPPAAAGESPGQFAERLADVLHRAMAPDWVYVRLGGTDADLEVARVGPSCEANGEALQIGRALAPWLDGGGPAAPGAV